MQPSAWYARLRPYAPRLVDQGDARYLIIAVGLATFVFGLLVGALVNLYFLAVHDPLVYELRATVTYRSAIVGDGLLLPLVNMAAAHFLLRERRHVGRGAVVAAVLLGAAITAYLHIMQAVNQLVNWSMPTPWHWNGIGVMHGLYMLAVTSWLVLFVLVVLKFVRRASAVPMEAGIVLFGVLVFLVLLRLDYLSADLQWMPLLR